MHRTRMALLVLLLAAAGLGACGDDEASTSEATEPAAAEPVIDLVDAYAPEFDPESFVDAVDNPYLPLVPGTTLVYEAQTEDGLEIITVRVTSERKEIRGISATVVRDTVTLDGEITEDTYDWFAQDQAGNVWYLGEATEEYEDGQVVSSEGSFEAGVGGAQAGIIMPAHPAVRQAYEQEHLEGEAEDRGEILRLGETVSVPAGEFHDVLVTRDWNPLEPDVVEEKHYAPGVGVVLEVTVRGGDERVELVERTSA